MTAELPGIYHKVARLFFGETMMKTYKREKTLTFLVACSLVSFFCSTQEAQAEEVLSSLPTETPFPEAFFSVSPSLSELSPSFREEPLSTTVSEEVLPFKLPGGKEVVLERLQSKFLVGKRAMGFVYHPEVTLTIRTGKGLHNYMSWDKTEIDPRLLTEDEKIALGFHYAEYVTESIQALPIPFVGSLLAGCLKVGEDVERINKRIKTKYRLHLRFSGKSFQAAYKESF